MGMFGKRRVMRIILRDEAGHTVFDDLIERLTLPEDVILSMCLEFYNDPAPCEIHRGAAVSRAFGEIELHGAGRFLANGMPERLCRYFACYEAYEVLVEHQER
jgi:hypothetical protein